MDDALIVALYARVSSQRQADELTIQSQLAALKQRISDDRLTLDVELT
jgi:predicted site-specific integrase-resolvase